MLKNNKFLVLILSFTVLFVSCKKDDGGPVIGNVTDKQGNKYETVEINSQEWMKENLIISQYNNGDAIPQVQDETEWKNLTTGAWCYYNDTNGVIYGKLYNWYAINDERGICPPGWHIPTTNDWIILANEYKGTNIAGGYLKAVAKVPDKHPRWINPNAGATNTSKFTALPGGFRNVEAEFRHLGSLGVWWTSSLDINKVPWMVALSYNDEKVQKHPRPKKHGFSVRCVRSTVGLGVN